MTTRRIQTRRAMPLMLALLSSLALPQTGSAAASLPLTEFMEQIRQPFLRRVKGTASGTLQHRGHAGRRRLGVELSFLFSPQAARATATLQSGDSCDMIWRHGDAESAQLVEQTNTSGLSLTDLGFKPEDLTFSFLFWSPVEERRRETVSGQPCRVILLRHPNSEAEVLGWFSEKFRFPLRLEWYRAGDPEPERVCEFTRFKQLEDGTWFIRDMRIYGQGWKTKLTLADASMTPFE